MGRGGLVSAVWLIRNELERMRLCGWPWPTVTLANLSETRMPLTGLRVKLLWIQGAAFEEGDTN